MIILRNSLLKIQIAPEWGGKITSVFHFRNKQELLFQNPNNHCPESIERDNFGQWAWGWDECFPDIHGELWGREFKVDRQTAQELELTYTASDFPFRYRKKICLEGQTIKVCIEIQNSDSQPHRGAWTLHCLVRLESDMQLIEPAGTKKKILECGVDLHDKVFPPPGEISKFWYTEPISEGLCGINYPKQGMSCKIQWDPQALPALAWWVTNKGFQGDENGAWEPSDGFPQSPIYTPGGKKIFEYKISWESMN